MPPSRDVQLKRASFASWKRPQRPSTRIHARGTPPEEAADRLVALAAAMIEQRTSGVTLDLGRLGPLGEVAGGRGYRAPQVRQRLVGR